MLVVRGLKFSGCSLSVPATHADAYVRLPLVATASSWIFRQVQRVVHGTTSMSDQESNVWLKPNHVALKWALDIHGVGHFLQANPVKVWRRYRLPLGHLRRLPIGRQFPRSKHYWPFYSAHLARSIWHMQNLIMSIRVPRSHGHGGYSSIHRPYHWGRRIPDNHLFCRLIAETWVSMIGAPYDRGLYGCVF